MYDNCMNNYMVAVQPNGEYLRYERWVYIAWLHGTIQDTAITRGLETAVRLYWSYQ